MTGELPTVSEFVNFQTDWSKFNYNANKEYYLLLNLQVSSVKRSAKRFVSLAFSVAEVHVMMPIRRAAVVRKS